jgi:hypothetical protein
MNPKRKNQVKFILRGVAAIEETKRADDERRNG